MRMTTALVMAGLTLALAAPASASNIRPYYLADGDSSIAYEITNGVVTNTFTTFDLAYPLAVRGTIWLGHRDDASAAEFSLAGVATGATSVGGTNFSQLLDGATAPTRNYGVECCGSPNSVTVANADWTNQQVLFNLPANRNGQGILFDPTDSTLYVSSFDDTAIIQFDLDGNILNRFDLDQGLVGLAYEDATDTFWGFNTTTDNLVQFNRAGVILADVDIPNFNPSNPYGGEMPLGDLPPPAVPAPATLLLLGAALAGLGFARRRR